MAKPLDYTKLKKQYLNVTLIDGTKLLIGTPTKKVMEQMLAMRSSLEALENGEGGTDEMDELYEVCAKIMNRNKAGISITADYLAETMDLEDLIIFMTAYTDFVGEMEQAKN